MDNERLQEIFLVVGDSLAQVSKLWWYALVLAFVLVIPGFFFMKFTFEQIIVSHYQGPKIIYATSTKEPLQLIDKKIFSLGNNAYSGFIKIKNINLEWGAASQQYFVEFKTFGGTTINTINGQTFILPSSEKLVVFSKFTSPIKPDVMNVTLADTHFLLRPDLPTNLELERVSIQNNPDGLVVSAGVKNLTAFTIKQLSLPVAVYNNKNQIVAVNYTYVNDLISSETRTFQYFWPSGVAGAVRAEITPEINIFDRNVFANPESNPSIIDQGGP